MMAAARLSSASRRALLAPPRPRRSPAIPTRAPTTCRMFMQRHPLLLFPRSTLPRPQLPYLSQPSVGRLVPAPALQRSLARLLTTENRRYVKEQTWLAIKWSALGWAMFGLLSLAWYGWQSELVEREHPSPSEWSFTARSIFRSAYMAMRLDAITDWAEVASDFRNVLTFLEDPAMDGKGVVRSESADKVVLDISAKSYPWRTGYFEVVMACGRAAEMLHNMVVDTTRNRVFPKDVVIGPSNPNPRPLPPSMSAAPLEENCARPYDPPEAFYRRILEGKGFTTRQRMDAALAYANWLENSGAGQAAVGLYDRAVEMARSDATSTVTANTLRADITLGTHHARNGSVDKALPILLAALQAYRSAPLDPTQTKALDQPATTRHISDIFRFSSYPKPGPSGNEPFNQSATDCSEAEMMLYIGEILFASSPSDRLQGLAWTKAATEIIRRRIETLRSATSSSSSSDDRDKKCKACLTMGVGNWEKMVSTLAAQDRLRAEQASRGWRSWTGLGGSGQDSHWQSEAEHVQSLRDSLARERVVKAMSSGAKFRSGSWLG